MSAPAATMLAMTMGTYAHQRFFSGFCSGFLAATMLALGSHALAADAATPKILPPVRTVESLSDKCISHRGNVDSPANTEETVDAYRQSIAFGAKIEDGDIRWTENGYPMMLHDSTLDVFGKPDIKLNTLSVGEAKSYTSTTGDVIASLYDVRTIAKGFPTIQWQLELKEEPKDWDLLDSRLSGLENRVTLSSFSLTRVREAQDHGYRTLYLTATDTGSTAAPVVGQDLSTIDASHVAALKAVGVSTYTYTPDDEASWAKAFDAGVAKVWTNYPQACSAYVASR